MIRLIMLCLSALCILRADYPSGVFFLAIAGYLHWTVWRREKQEKERFEALTRDSELEVSPFQDWDRQYARKYAPEPEAIEIPEGAIPVRTMAKGIVGYRFPETRKGFIGKVIGHPLQEEGTQEEYVRQRLDEIRAHGF